MYKFKKSLVSLMMAGAVVTSTFDMSSIVANAEPVEASANKIYGYDDAGVMIWLYVAMLVASFGALAVFRKTQRA